MKNREGPLAGSEKYRRNVLLDPQARKKARLAAALSYSGYAMTRRVYEKRSGVEKVRWRDPVGGKKTACIGHCAGL